MKKLVLLSIFCLSAHASAPAPDIEKKITSAWGNLYLLGNMQYMSEDPQNLIIHHRLNNLLNENEQPIKIQSSDVIVDVWADSQESDNWSSHSHPVLGNSFPNALPLSMLEGKNEGDPLVFKLNCPQRKTVCNILVLCHGRNGESLKSQINRIKERFAESPNFSCGDEKRLLAQQILIKNPAYDEIEEIKNKLRNIPRPSIFDFYPEGKEYEQNALRVSQKIKHIEELKRLIQQKKEEYSKTNKLDFMGMIPQYFHGPNGFKLSSPIPAIATQSETTAQEAQSVTKTITQSASSTPSKPMTKLDEMD